MRSIPRLLIIFLPFILANAISHAQPRTIRGFIRDAESGENMQGATVSIMPAAKNINSNNYGFYSLTLQPGTYRLYCSYVGYELLETELQLTSDTIFNISMKKKKALSTEVILTARKRDDRLRNNQMGKISLSMDKIRSLPALMGEVDLVRSLLLLPGVANPGEGSSGIYVRGGGPDQNLILLDDAVVYNSGHLFGFFSVFNADAINNVTLIKGGMPARYGGRLSSVLDITMKEGNNKEIKMDGGIGLISSRLSLQGPLKKNKASFMLSGRRTYADALAKPFISKESSFYGSGYYFYDANVKFNYIFNDKDRIFVSGYWGRDLFNFVNARQSFKVRVPWGNATGTVRWNHVFNKKLFTNTSAVYNNYDFTFKGTQNNLELQLNSGIRDFSLKQDFDWYPFSGHTLKFGWLYIHHRFTPSLISGKQDSIVFAPANPQRKFAQEGALYFQDDWEITPHLSVQGGLRYSYFRQTGPYTYYNTDANGNRIDSVVFSKGQPVRTYSGPEPRLACRISINDNTSLKASVSRNLQFIHLVSNTGSTLPTDIWVPSSRKVAPQKSWLYALGLFKNFDHNQWEASLECYFKDMRNQIEYKEGYVPNTLEDIENSFVFGRGWSYGSEVFLSKNKGRLTGWIGYTLSWTWRKFPSLNEGIRYPARFDRRHDLSLVASYTINTKWRMSATFVYATGNAITLPQRFYVIEGSLSQEYSRINQYRLPAYHRADVAFIYAKPDQEKKKFKSEWVFSIYNLYNRRNPYFIYFDQSTQPTGGFQIQAKQVSIFPLIPSVTWNFSL